MRINFEWPINKQSFVSEVFFYCAFYYGTIQLLFSLDRDKSLICHLQPLLKGGRYNSTILRQNSTWPWQLQRRAAALQPLIYPGTAADECRGTQIQMNFFPAIKANWVDIQLKLHTNATGMYLKISGSVP